MLAQSRMAFAVPSWVMAQVHWQILKTTAFLGVPTNRGFAVEGTCFFLTVVDEELAFTYIVTCAHVVQPFRAKRSQEPNAEPIWVRMNRKEGPPRVEKTIRGDWISHPSRSVDICIYPFPRTEWDADDGLDISQMLADTIVLPSQKYPQVGLSLGDEVFIVGAFVGRVGDKKNIPVVRIANIASMPDEPAWPGSATRPAFLLETRSLGGISGSPFFIHPHQRARIARNWELHVDDKGTVTSPYLLIGMVQGIHGGQYANDFVADDDIEKIVPKDADFNAGMAIGLPIEQVIEVINRDDLKEARMAIIDAKRKESGHRPASNSASNSSAEIDDANPHHQEDFKRLVDVAARKRPQDDQT